MKRLGIATASMSALLLAGGASAAEFSFHGDFNHRFLYTNHHDWIKSTDHKGTLDDGEVNDFFGELKYRLWTEASTNDGDVKGVFALEFGGIRFGEKSKGGSYSGDGTGTTEVRWAYTDFQLPGVDQKARIKIGLQPWKVNKWLWSETATGGLFYGGNGAIDYKVGWARTYEYQNASADSDSSDVDNFLVGMDFKTGGSGKMGLFGLYQTGDPDSGAAGAITPEGYYLKKFADGVDLGIFSVGVTGDFSFPMGNSEGFVQFDGIYQSGEINNATFEGNTGDFDLSAYFLHADLGMKMGATKLTYTFWYASGDDDPTDEDFEAFLSTDVDINESIGIFEGSYGDDNYFAARPYLLDKGFMMNKLALDYKVNSQMKLGIAGLYMTTAEDIEYMSASDGESRAADDVGFEVDAYVKYKLFKNLELALNAGYLWSGDAMDYFEVDSIQDGSADENIFITSARVRYKF